MAEPRRSFPTRVVAAWRALRPEQRRVAIAALLLLGSMLLPWYSKNVNAITKAGLSSQDQAKMAITVFSFVEAAIFLVAVSILALMFARGERRAFHLPFGDGIIVAAGGAWACVLVFYRFVDQPGGGTSKNIAYDYGLSWGIFFGLLAALFLTVAGMRLHAAHVGEPPLPGDVDPAASHGPQRRDRRPRPTPDRAHTVVTPRPPREPRGPRPGEVPAPEEPPELRTTRVAPSTPAGRREDAPAPPPATGEQLRLDDE